MQSDNAPATVPVAGAIERLRSLLEAPEWDPGHDITGDTHARISAALVEFDAMAAARAASEKALGEAHDRIATLTAERDAAIAAAADNACALHETGETLRIESELLGLANDDVASLRADLDLALTDLATLRGALGAARRALLTSEDETTALKQAEEALAAKENA